MLLCCFTFSVICTIAERSSSSLAMTFPAKGRKSSQQIDRSQSTEDEYLDSFFKQSSTKLKPKSRTPSRTKTKAVSFLLIDLQKIFLLAVMLIFDFKLLYLYVVDFAILIH